MLRLVAPVFALIVAVIGSGDASAQSATPSANDFGGIGLLETRTARMAPEGTFEIGGIAREPFRGVYVLAQPLPWLEINFRYTDFTNVRRDGTVLALGQIDFLETVYGFKGGGTVRDRGFDLKLRLLEETDWLPAIAAGLQDMFGEARFGGEYIVASKAFGPFDFSLGLGWGFLGSRDQFGNPLSFLSNSLKRRREREGEGGINLRSFFSGGDVAIFGGVEWHTPLDGLSLKVEYSGIDPRRAPFDVAFDQDLPINFGLNYRPTRWFDLAVGFERGNTIMTRAAIRFDLFDLGRTAGMAPEPITDRPSAPTEVPEAERGESIEVLLARYLVARGLGPGHVQLEAAEATLLLAPGHAPPIEAWGDEARALFAILPGRVSVLWIGHENGSRRDALMFLRALDSRDAAQAIMTLVGSGPVSIDGGALEVTSTGSALPSGIALLLPESITSLGTADSKRDIRPDRAFARAQEMASLSDLGTVERLELDGDGKLTALVDGSRAAGTPDLVTLIRATGVRSVLVQDTASVRLGRAEAQALFDALDDQAIYARAVALEEDRLTIWIGNAPDDREAETTGRVARRLLGIAPQRVAHLRIVRAPGNFSSYSIDLLRRDVARAATGTASPEEVWLTSRVTSQSTSLDLPAGTFENESSGSRFRWGVVPTVEQTIGNDDSGFYLADLNVDLALSFEILPGLELSGALRRFIAGNLDNLMARPSQGLAIARSDFVDFIEDGRTSIPYLQANWLFAPADGLTARLSAGLFERMYGGIGGEAYYRPEGASLAITGELFWVRKRDTDGFFAFSGRDVITGEIGATAYFDDEMEVSLRAGRYLAGDLGATFEISRRFGNGMRLGGYLTWSEDANLDFRSDSLNKGVYIVLPIGGWWRYAGPRQSMTARFSDIARDSGASLVLNQRLHELVAQHAVTRLYSDWPQMSGSNR